MTQTYRTDDLTKWGTGTGSNRNLTPAEVDINFWDVIQRVVTLEALPSAAAGIDHFSVSGTQFYVILTDATTLGPYTLPVATFNARGEWAPSTSYALLDTFTINGSLYVVIFAHTSELTFDAGANDGFGHDYYSLMIETPGSSLPTGGATGQVLQKSSSTDYATTWGYKLPIDGNTRQVLLKDSNTNQDAVWDDLDATDIGFTPVTGSTLTSNNVADALEELSGGAGTGDAIDITYTPPSGSSLVSDNVQDAIDELEAAAAAGTGRYPTVTAIGNSGFVTMNQGLGDIFTTSPTADIDVLFDDFTATPGARITLLITTVNASGFHVRFNSSFKGRGDLWLPKVSGVKVSISWIVDDNTIFWEISRTGDQAPVDLGNVSGTQTFDNTFGEVVTLTPSNTTTLDATVAGGPGRRTTIVITTSGTSSFVVTFGANMKSTGTLSTGTADAKVFTISFVSDGTNLCEVSRSTAM